MQRWRLFAEPSNRRNRPQVARPSTATDRPSGCKDAGSSLILLTRVIKVESPVNRLHPARPIPPIRSGATPNRPLGSRRDLKGAVFSLLLLLLGLATPGCGPRPRLVAAADQGAIDRAVVEYPSGFAFGRYIENLTGPTAIAFDEQGSIIIAEGGIGDRSPAIFGFRPDGTRFDIYRDPQLPFGIAAPRAKLYGPIGGILY